MKVLFYSPLSLRFGGGFEHWVLELVGRLKSYGVESTIVCTKFTSGDSSRIPSDKIRELVDKAGARYYELSYIFSLPVGSSPVLKFCELSKITDSLRCCDLLYFANAYAFQDIFIYFLKLMFHKPVISGHHATFFSDSLTSNLYAKSVRRTLLKKFDAFHVLNSDDVNLLKKFGLKNIYEIPISVDTQKFSPKKDKGNKNFRVLFVGRLTSQKGVDVLCESIRLLSKDTMFKQIEFWIVGSGPLAYLVEQLADTYSNVNFLRYVSDERLPEIYRNSHILVMPSRRETFGIVALEAQACGLPVIATWVAGLRSIIINNVTGTLIPKQDAQALRLMIKKYFDLFQNSYDEYNRLALNARENVLRRYDWRVTLPLVYNMFTSLITGR